MANLFSLNDLNFSYTIVKENLNNYINNETNY